MEMRHCNAMMVIKQVTSMFQIIVEPSSEAGLMVHRMIQIAVKEFI